MERVELQRIDLARNMRRFYRLDVEPDLFGASLLMKEWWSIGGRGRVIAQRFENGATALAALWQLVDRKMRGGYVEAAA